MRKIWVGVVLVLSISCGKDDVALTNVDATVTEWLNSMSIIATRDDSGIYYYPIVSNPSGTSVSSQSVVSIYYTLSDLDSNFIASHLRSNGDSLSLKQGVSAVYPIGLDIGLSFMREGETFGIIIPPSLGYKDLTSGAIDSKIISLFQVEVVGVRDEAGLFTQELIDINTYITAENLNDTIANPIDSVRLFTSGVAYKRISIGVGSNPLNGDTIILNYSGRFLNNAQFENINNFQVIFGSDVPRPLIPGFEFGLSLMQTNERALIIIPSSQAYRESALAIPDFISGDLIADSIIPDYVATIPAYKTLIFDVTRVD